MKIMPETMEIETQGFRYLFRQEYAASGDECYECDWAGECINNQDNGNGKVREYCSRMPDGYVCVEVKYPNGYFSVIAA